MTSRLSYRLPKTDVSASHSEGFPSKIPEATCAGLPVVAAAVNRVIAQVVDGRADLLVRGGDRMALAGTLLVLAREPGCRFGMCGALVDYSFPIERTAAALDQAYSWLAEICFDRQPWMRGSASPEIRAGRAS